MKLPIPSSLVLLFAGISSTAHGRRSVGRGLKSERSGESSTSKSGKKETSVSCGLEGAVIVANRAGKSISVVNPDTLETIHQESLPDSGEPMYFAYNQAKNEIWVGDRANSRQVIYKLVGCGGLELDGYVPTPDGLFHAFPTQVTGEKYKIVATACDDVATNVVVLHDMTTRRMLAKLEMPQEVVTAGGKPHDVTVSGDYVIATFLSDSAGFVATYMATYPYDQVGLLETELDPHVAIRDDTNLFVAAQGPSDGDGLFAMVSMPDLTILESSTPPSPHGLFISRDSKYVYLTNIAEAGQMAVNVFDATTGQSVEGCSPVTTTHPVPHNPVLNLDNDRIFITHSGGASNANSAFNIDTDTGCVDPDSEEVYYTNLNPFGVGFYIFRE